jgi:RimJ/RimL family protein N-acetyltransferase
MIVEANADDFAALIKGLAPPGLALPDTPIEQPEVLQMLADLAIRVSMAFLPAAWMIVDQAEIVGLCSVLRPPVDGAVDIGYGIAPGRRGRGFAGQAVGEIVAWASCAPGVTAVTAETGRDNLPSQRVLQRNGFARVGQRIDDDDGPLICWRKDVA